MSAAPDQLVFDLPHRAALGIQDFLVSASNQAAAEMIDRWPHWSDHAVLMVAPAGAGKTHLANVWRLKSGAAVLTGAHLGEADVLAAAGALLIEDLHVGIGSERALFHLLNLAREHSRSMLLTSRLAPGALAVALPDLRSRLRALPLIEIAPPDAALLRAVLVKHFADRQLMVEPHVVAHLALHMEQSMEAAAAIVAELDRAAMASHRRITRGLVGEILARQQGRLS
ncbi:MAG TPA: DnaA/Hda family protein [Hyphomicrobiaceae bacterium]|jgi:chromosomal replication initiation ATPase DnaA|nr:DnaA/Hda family protein [Hyphomicrobiaceae bacterium]